jgi:hypothetical protein
MVLGIVKNSDTRPGASGLQFSECNSDDSSILSTTLDEIWADRLFHKCIIKIDVDGIDFKILQGASKLLASGTVASILIETNDDQLSEIESFLGPYGLRLQDSSEYAPIDSDDRRRRKGSKERNRIFSSPTEV